MSGSTRELLQQLMNLHERRDVDTMEALLDQEADRLNASMFQGQGAYRAFAALTPGDYMIAMDLKSRCEWQGRLCVLATGQTRRDIERFGNACGLSLFRPTVDTVVENLPSSYIELLRQRDDAELYDRTVSQLWERSIIKVGTIAEMETLIDVIKDERYDWRFRVRIVADNAQVAATLREMAEGQGMRISSRGN